MSSDLSETQFWDQVGILIFKELWTKQNWFGKEEIFSATQEFLYKGPHRQDQAKLDQKTDAESLMTPGNSQRRLPNLANENIIKQQP